MFSGCAWVPDSQELIIRYGLTLCYCHCRFFVKIAIAIEYGGALLRCFLVHKTSGVENQVDPNIRELVKRSVLNQTRNKNAMNWGGPRIQSNPSTRTFFWPLHHAQTLHTCYISHIHTDENILNDWYSALVYCQVMIKKEKDLQYTN